MSTQVPWTYTLVVEAEVLVVSVDGTATYPTLQFGVRDRVDELAHSFTDSTHHGDELLIFRYLGG